MVQEATKKESLRITVATFLMTAVMIVVFYVLHAVVPEQVPFDYKVFLAGVCGAAVASLNFFLMGLAVQKVAAQQNQDMAYRQMKASYTQRTMLQVLWVILAFVLPCMNGAAGVIPLFFPSAYIKFLYPRTLKKAVEEERARNAAAEQKTEEEEERGDN